MWEIILEDMECVVVEADSLVELVREWPEAIYAKEIE